ncbi:BglG family transcription antiterminator [Brevibacillus massiliensis]|uniref:BglG family transcription antiterminator n=1 Tax=Brevibacillus massiliensis TaxID=1118054 RepID=UPI00030B7A4D|nr:BglG family transcription antiterminator [Brevibacillus massiliensis]
MLDERSSTLLKLITSSRTATFKQLTQQMNCTRRQIVYDLAKINLWLKSQGLPLIANQRAHGLTADTAVREFLLRSPPQVKFSTYILSKEERVFCIIIQLFVGDEHTSLFHIASRFKTSRNTALADIQRANRFAAAFQVAVVYTRGKGYHLAGEERNKRALVMKCISRLLHQVNGMRILERVLADKQKEPAFPALFAQACSALREAEDALQLVYVEEKINAIAVFLVILFSRGAERKHVVFSQEEQVLLRQTREFDVAKRLIARCGQPVHEAEVCYIALLLLSISLKRSDYQIESKHMQMLYQLVLAVVEEFELLACVSFADRKRVIDTLFLHMKPAYYRVVFQIPITNPFLQQIKAEHFDLFTLVKKAWERFEQFVGIPLPEDEIAYLTLHFGALLEAQGGLHIRRKQAIIICPNGVGTSNMLKEQIGKLVPEISITATISLREFQEKHERQCDLIFSTVFIQTEKPVIVVNPILSSLDKATILREVYTIVHGKSQVAPSVQDIMQTVKRFAVIADEDGLRSALTTALTGSMAENIRRYKPVLKELLTEDMIQLHEKVKDWEEAITLASKPLIDIRAIEARYVEAMIQNIRRLGPYIVLTPRVAVPHARPEDGVKKVGISLLKLSEEVAFSEESDRRANLIFVLAAIDNETHLRALGQLTELISEADNVDKLIAARQKAEILQMVEHYSLK